MANQYPHADGKKNAPGMGYSWIETYAAKIYGRY
jgi:hypothetical protein